MQLYSAAALKTRLKRYDDAGPEGLWRPAIETEGEHRMEEKNQPRRPRRAPEEQTRNESLVYGKTLYSCEY